MSSLPASLLTNSERSEAPIAGRYQVLRLLGQGGMGAVYAVLDTATGAELALKRLSSGANATTTALFEREYQTLAGLRHPAIVEVYEYGQDQDGPFYTMELIDGTDLSKQAPMPWREACRDLRDAASILGLLHARQLLHRDLSPRNLLRSRNGQLKLIDFGALAKFGPSQQIVGTPPFVAPEALRNVPLDQRTDLFALGALAYWLVTGVHAYPARTLNELPQLWKVELTPPSQLLTVLKSDALPPIPPELDALIASLLRVDPAERTSGTGELIDQLNVLAGLAPESDDQAVQGYLNSKAFVGRTRERERAAALLVEAAQGQVTTLVVEGDAGIGRSRFLDELVVMARLGGALPVVAKEDVATRPFGVAERLLLELLRTLPTETRAQVMDHASLLSTISKELRAELPASGRPSMVHGAAETRIRVLNALRDVLLALSRDRLLALVVDDLQAIDDESQALLTALAHAEPGHKLLIVAAVGRDAGRETSPALTNLRAQATRVRLLPLTLAETLELLRSVFGQAPYLSRLAERLHRASEGNPAYTLELAEHLVQTGTASYRDGSWTLPVELSDGSLPPSRQAAQVARLDRLSSEARQLARSLSVPHSTDLSPEQSLAVAELPAERVSELLLELERANVLRATGGGHRFAQATVQDTLYRELDQSGRERAHLQLGAQLLASSDRDVFSELRACTHFLRGGDVQRAYQRQLVVLEFYKEGDMSSLGRAAPLLAEVYELHRARGHDKYAIVGVLGLLGISGYFADRGYAKRFGDRAIAMLQDVLRMSLVARLERFLGSKLALFAGLIVAGISLRLRADRVPDLRAMIRIILGAAASLSGTSAVCLDPDNVARYADVIRPFRVLGEDHGASITYRFAGNILPHLRDQSAEAIRRLKAFIARLESPRPIEELPDGPMVNYLAGSVFMLGILESALDGPECLQTAEKLDEYGPLYCMSADHLRASYYSGQGNLERAEYYRERVEVHAVQLGSAWQVETWAPSDAIHVALRLHDVRILKRAVQELGRLSVEIPSLIRTERQCRGAYLVMRGKYAEAIELLDNGEPLCSYVAWTRTRGLLARAHNRLGQHARAKEVCLEAISFHTQDDLDFVNSGLVIQLELALAEASLGSVALAKHQLDKLLTRNATNDSALTLGAIHHARASVSLQERDFASARTHLAKMEDYYRGSGVATLIELVAPLKREIDRTENPRAADADSLGLEVRLQHVMTRVQLLLSENGNTLVAERASKGLQLALELSSADEGFLVLADSEGEPAAHLGSDAPSAELVSWAQQNILDACVDEQTVMTEDVDSEVDSNYRVVGSMHYCVVPLWAPRNREDRVVAALVLGFDNRVPRVPEPAVMRAIALHLVGRAEGAS